MLIRSAAPPLCAFAVLLAGAAGSLAQTDGSAGTGTDTASPADSTGKARNAISTDGAVTVFEEAEPGEGIEGFWWEYDAAADLERLLDLDRSQHPLDRIRDPFGFELVIPDTILALRDSVSAVADSILAERIDLTAVFDPKFTSVYDERKDEYSLKNEFSTSYPLTRAGNVAVTIGNNNEFNRSTGKVKDGRRVNTSFNYALTSRTVSSFAINLSDDLQERNGVKDSQSDAVSLNGQLRDNRDAGILGKLEASGGVSFSRRNYETSVTDGRNSQVTPDWKVKLTRPYSGGSASVDYTGNLGTSTREEQRTFLVDDGTGTGNLVDSTVVDNSDETNFNNRVNTTANYVFGAGTDLKFQGIFGRDQFQFLSQVDSLIGQQETRTRDSRSGQLNLTSKPVQGLEVRSRADYRVDETDFQLENVKTRATTTRLANADVTYEAWGGARWAFKMEASQERRDFTTSQAGDVTKREASVDYRQDILEDIGFEASYYVTLDRFEFDDKVANPGDRDLRTQRGTFTVRYNPFSTVTSSVRMELRKTDSVNILPPKSGDNSTDHGFLINPQYTWKVGKASFRGDFTADARYKVQDFDDTDNTLNRRFAIRQSWQHAFTSRLSTETQYRWELNDQGSYNRNPIDLRRRFARSRETRRSTLELKILYKLFKGVRANVGYRRDEDATFNVEGGDRSQLNDRPRRQFQYAVDVKRDLFQRTRMDLSFRQTFKDGAISDVESNFYTIRAQLTYQPLKEAEGRKGRKR